MKKIDCTKITTLEEVKLILASLDLHININAEHYDKLKHLVVDKQCHITVVNKNM